MASGSSSFPILGPERGERRKAMETARAGWHFLSGQGRPERGERRKAMETPPLKMGTGLFGSDRNAVNAERQWRPQSREYFHSRSTRTGTR